jgi:hypothetical protein
MRRFAKLTRDGLPCYVDPNECGSIVASDTVLGDGTRFTEILQRSPNGVLLLDRIEEPPDEVYRRLAAAGQVATAADVEEVKSEMTVVVAKVADALLHAREAGWRAESESAVRDYVQATIKAPLLDYIHRLESTVLAALYTAEGREAQKE